MTTMRLADLCFLKFYARSHECSELVSDIVEL